MSDCYIVNKKNLNFFFKKRSQKIDSSLIAEINALAYSEIQSKLFKKRLSKRKKASTTQFDDYMK